MKKIATIAALFWLERCAKRRDWASAPVQRWALGILVSMVAAVFSHSASAEGPWRINCATDKMTDKRQCFVSKGHWPNIDEPYIHIIYALDRQFWGGYTVDPARRLRVRVDDNPVLTSTACGRSGCLFDVGVSELLTEQVRTGKLIKVEITTISDRVIGPYELSTDGFHAAFDRAQAGATE